MRIGQKKRKPWETEGDKRSQENSLEVLQFKLREEILESRERHQVEQINNWSNI